MCVCVIVMSMMEGLVTVLLVVVMLSEVLLVPLWMREVDVCVCGTV